DKRPAHAGRYSHDDVRAGKSCERARGRLCQTTSSRQHRLPDSNSANDRDGRRVRCRTTCCPEKSGGPRVAGIHKPRDPAGGQVPLSKSGAAIPLTVIAGAILLAACTEIPSGANDILSFQFDPLPSPSVVFGDSLRDSLGVVRGITLKA